MTRQISLEEHIADMVVELDVDQDARNAARMLVVDWLAVTVAARENAQGHISRSYFDSPGPATELLFGTSVRASDAAAANSYLSHLLDFDDVLFALPGHVSCTVVPVLLAITEQEGLSVAEFLRGVAVGVEVAGRLGDLVGSKIHQAGWHPTSYLGGVAAAAGVARILKFSKERTTRLLAMVAVKTFGILDSAGGRAKSWQVAETARTVIEVLRLFQSGFDLQTQRLLASVLEVATGEDSFLITAAEVIGSERRYYRELIYKFFPSCFATHPAIRAAQRIAQAVPRHAGYTKIRAVRVYIGERFQKLVGTIHQPRTELELKFSATGLVTAVLAQQDVRSIAQFAPETFLTPEFLELEHLMHLHIDPDLNETDARVELQFIDGSVISRTEHQQGPFNRELESDSIVEKLRTSFELLQLEQGAVENLLAVLENPKAAIVELLEVICSSGDLH